MIQASNIFMTPLKRVSRKNISYYLKKGVFYRTYRDRKGKLLGQLVVSHRYPSDFLHLSHGSLWSGHLGVKKTKDRMLQEVYWPGCFRECEKFVKSCDTCQRVGKSNQTSKAP